MNKKMNSKKEKKTSPWVGLEPTALRLRVSRATDCATKAFAMSGRAITDCLCRQQFTFTFKSKSLSLPVRRHSFRVGIAFLLEYLLWDNKQTRTWLVNRSEERRGG